MFIISYRRERKMNDTWKLGIAVAFGLVLAGVAAAAPARIIDVEDAARGANDGTRWANAYVFLQDALADANTSEKPAEIRVAQGVYLPDRGVGQVRGNQKATFQLMNGVSLLGGYAGAGQADAGVCDVDRYTTILSGDLAGDDVEVNELVDLVNATLGNSHTVVTGTGTDHTAVLDGFTITRGHWYALVPRSTGPRVGSGAGMNNCPGSPTVRNCTFSHNVTDGVGAGIYGEDGRLTVVNCRFIMNFAAQGGGAMANIDGCEAHVKTCSFESNSAWANGGALYNETSPCTLLDCRFEGNSAFMGGALHALDNSAVTMERCVFIGNRATLGGAACLRETGNSLVASGCTFRRNRAKAGGGALLDGGMENHLALFACTFSDNRAQEYGGALYLANGTVANCLFAGNRAIPTGPIDPQSGPGLGGAVANLAPREPLTITNCTFDQNRAGRGSAIYHTHDKIDISNSVIRGSSQEIHPYGFYMVTNVRYSNVQAGWPGAGNIDADSCFARPGYWANADDPNLYGDPSDPNSIWVDGDYHLRSQAGRWDPATETWVIDDVTSPCTDAGDPNSPVGHEPFPNGGRINMGAYGGTAEASKSYFGEPACETIIAGDINGDCRVDFADFEIMSRHWLEGRHATEPDGGNAEP
jgi:hypothetical protein